MKYLSANVKKGRASILLVDVIVVSTDERVVFAKAIKVTSVILADMITAHSRRQNMSWNCLHCSQKRRVLWLW